MYISPVNFLENESRAFYVSSDPLIPGITVTNRPVVRKKIIFDCPSCTRNVSVVYITKYNPVLHSDENVECQNYISNLQIDLNTFL